VSFDSACPTWNKFCPARLSYPGASKRARGRLQVIFDVLMAQDVDRFVHLGHPLSESGATQRGLVRATLSALQFTLYVRSTAFVACSPILSGFDLARNEPVTPVQGVIGGADDLAA
jgi:hypothetical protein